MDVWTATEAARELNVSKELMARYCREGRLPGSERKGRCWLIPAAALERFRLSHAHYRRGRPHPPDPSIFWREPKSLTGLARAEILARRCPTALPHWVTHRAARAFARAGRTRIERIVRRAMVKELYAVCS